MTAAAPLAWPERLPVLRESVELSNAGCTHCGGLGLVMGRKFERRTCNCVLRAIFRVCYARYRHYAEQEPHLNPMRHRRTQTWSWPQAEYLADFEMVSRRMLAEVDYKIFRFHFLLGADWKLCCRRMGIDRGTFFHAVYRVQEQLGRAYRELAPYPLYPPGQYCCPPAPRDP